MSAKLTLRRLRDSDHERLLGAVCVGASAVLQGLGSVYQRTATPNTLSESVMFFCLFFIFPSLFTSAYLQFQIRRSESRLNPTFFPLPEDQVPYSTGCGPNSRELRGGL